MVTLEIIKDNDKFYRLESQWNVLLEKSGIENPYLTYEWLSSWWKAYGKGRGLSIAAFKDRDRIVGLIPLVLTREKFSGLPLKTVKFFADHWGTMDFILTAQKQECLRLFLDWFYSKSGVDVLILSRIPQASENVSLFGRLIDERKAKFEKYILKNSVINISGTWEEYLDGRSKNFSEELKYKQRKSARAGKVSYERTTVFEDATLVISPLLEITRNSWKHSGRIGVLDTAEGQEFYGNIIKIWGRIGGLNLTTLKINDKSVAFAIRINYKDKYYALETSFNKEYYPYSPGLLVQCFLLRELYKERRIKQYELGQTDNHKSRWTDDCSMEEKLIIYNKNIYPNALFFMRRLIKRLPGKSND